MRSVADVAIMRFSSSGSECEFLECAKKWRNVFAQASLERNGGICFSQRPVLMLVSDAAYTNAPDVMS